MAITGLEAKVMALGLKFLTFCIKIQLKVERLHLKEYLLRLLLGMAGKILILLVKRCEE